MSAPRVSVIMPVFNGGNYLAPALDSVLAQTFTDFELIALDDGSTDGSGDVLEEYARRDPRMRVIRQPNRGLVPTLNHGLGLATGEYIARMDADDLCDPTRFEKQVAYLDAHPEVGVLGTWQKVIDETGTVLYPDQLPVTHAMIRWKLLSDNCISHPSVIMLRRTVEQLGGYSQSALHAEDYDLRVRAAEVTRLANLAEPLIMHRRWSQSISRAFSDAQSASAALVRLHAASAILDAPPDGECVAHYYAALGSWPRVLPPSANEIVKLGNYFQHLCHCFVQKVPCTRSERDEIQSETARMLILLAKRIGFERLGASSRMIFDAIAISPLLGPKFGWLAGKKLARKLTQFTSSGRETQRDSETS